MATPLQFCLQRKPAYQADDVIQLKVNDILQPDRINPWGPSRRSFGFGHGRPARTRFGRWTLPGSLTVFGRGRFGQGVAALHHLTLKPFVAGDYNITLQAADDRRQAGNASGWSEPILITHRPTPPAPVNLQTEGGSLTWDWSDPA